MAAASPQLLPPSDPSALQEHLEDFEAWFIAVQKQHGMVAGNLLHIERAILLAYIKWLQTDKGTHAAADQAQ